MPPKKRADQNIMNQTASSIPADLIAALHSAKHVMVFTGAGVSAESGIPTFRDSLTGLWEQFDAGDLASPNAFRKDRDLVWGWYEWRRMKVLQAQPNQAHLVISKLATWVPKLTLVTQNVDDLHERAGSNDVIHLHGELCKPRCFACNRPYSLETAIPDEPEGGRRIRPPRCHHCRGYVRPGVVWFGESLPEKPLKLAFSAAKACDLLFVIGTSGVGMPAAQIPMIAMKAGVQVVEINPAPSLRGVKWAIGDTATRAMEAIQSAISSSNLQLKD